MIPKNFLARATIAFPRAAAVLDLFVVLLQILTVTLRDQSALDQRRSAELRAPRLVMRPLCSVSFELDTRGTIPKYAARLPSSAKSLMSPMIDNRMLPLSPPIPLMLIRFVWPFSF